MKRTVLEYNAIFQKEKEGGYSVWVPSLPGCASQGETFEEALANIQEAITLYLEDAVDVKETTENRTGRIRKKCDANPTGHTAQMEASATRQGRFSSPGCVLSH
ncbi:MAG: type II toxin-antitoxin system HicB family antitoxin [Chloroflexi bacterium]|nr:type II toxin-antitoxin system HicB family antitoxin [Chloroflexota bacterium]